ncbi:MAG: AAA family ATPase [Promethearchaeota archaeon]
MIVQAVKIKNIRSIKNLEIEFPPSTMLFFGDIGSGKSSVLKAIEFGLFGTLTAADLSGDSLLRRGENKGSIELTFSIDGKKYIIKRGLKRTKIKKKGEEKEVVTQETGSIIEYSGDEIAETSYAPTDLRRNILSILNYSIPRYENANKIPLFRYSVYTPQEQVKEILQADPKDRFEILKEVFGIEKYEITLKNIDVLTKSLNYKINEIEIHLKDIGDPESLIPEKKKEIDDKLGQIKSIEKLIIEKDKDIENEEKHVDKIQSELSEYSKKLVEINNHQKMVDESISSKEKIEKTLGTLAKEISDSETEIKNLLKIKLDSNLTEEQLENQIKERRKTQSEKDRAKAVLEKSIKDINKLLKEGKCSLCGQEIHEKERFDSELIDTKDRIEKLSNEIEKFKSEISELEANLKNLRAFVYNQTRKESLDKLIEEKKKRENELRNLINQLNDKIETNQRKISIILKNYNIKDLEKFKEFEDRFKSELRDQKNLVKKLQKEKSGLEKDLSAEKTNLKLLENKLNELEENLSKKKWLEEKLEYIKDLKNWIDNEFPILIRDIEREIISASARQFNEYFKEWFRVLVEEENIEVEIRIDDFEPIITVNGYDSPFRDLSGGEKSALSLAYRLALNKVINEKHQEVKTKDLLVLDEPTDGFSQEQINKMQDIFEKLNTAQMIIISHERNLDSFVTDIFNFKKENHITKVSREII